MASSLTVPSTKRAQVCLTVKCYFCRNFVAAKWKCLNCKIIMCEKCKVAEHAKNLNALKHNIVDIKEDGDIHGIPCNKHGDKLCYSYCRNCEEIICKECLVNSHLEHSKADIQTIYNEKLQYFRKQFSPEVHPKAFSFIFGYFNRLDVSEKAMDITLKLKNIIGTNLSFICPILRTTNSLWISCWKDQSLNELGIGPEITNLRTYSDKKVYDMTMLNDGELLTFVADSCLYHLIDHLNIVHDFSPLFAKAVHATSSDIIVSTQDKKGAFPITEHSRRQIVILELDGKTVLNIIEFNEKNTPLFSLPNRITTNLKGDILIIDTLSMSDLGKIICLDKVKGNVKWSYRGYPNVNDARGDNSFSPFDFAVTPVGNIVVADTINSALHFLSEAGIILKCFLTLSMDIKMPCSLDIDRDEMLWIGSNGYEGQSGNAKIQVLKYSGC